MQRHDNRGLSLIEALIAVSIMAMALAALGRITLLAAHANATAGATTASVLAGRQKIEQLRAVPDDHPFLVPSPADSLDADREGYFDRLVATGRPAATAAAFTRRWRVQALTGSNRRTLLLEVRVIGRSRAVRTVSSFVAIRGAVLR
jgi:hypothetical protein